MLIVVLNRRCVRLPVTIAQMDHFTVTVYAFVSAATSKYKFMLKAQISLASICTATHLAGARLAAPLIAHVAQHVLPHAHVHACRQTDRRSN